MSDAYWAWASDPDGPGIDADVYDDRPQRPPLTLRQRWAHVELPHWVVIEDNQDPELPYPRHDLDGFDGLLTEIDLDQQQGLVDLAPDFKGSEDDWWEVSTVNRISLVHLSYLRLCDDNVRPERPEPDDMSRDEDPF